MQRAGGLLERDGGIETQINSVNWLMLVLKVI